ncbi:MAG: TonB-dependent receptor [Dysgonamonadaceae bacterium]|nr:TonB-dependent receptor [Dysgonamonadaceae bacterium]
MKIPRIVFIGLCLFIFWSKSLSVYAWGSEGNSDTSQQKGIQLSGKVISEEGDPIAGATIKIKGNTFVVKMDEAGGFNLNLPSEYETIIISAPGYFDREMIVGRESTESIDILLKKDVNRLGSRNEVYNLFGSQRRDLITGAYSQIYGEQVENYGVTNNELRLTGLLPGLFVMQSNGEPGDEGSSMLIRGRRTFRGNSPIILVDGFERSMSLLDPNEIEAITVLKDAAATARYGLRGSNGIIQVTTKRGKEGKVKVVANIRGGLKKPTTEPKILDSYDYAQLYNEAQLNDNPNATPRYSETYLKKYMNARNGIIEDPNDIYLYPNINWYKEFTNDNTWQQRYSVSLSGGNDFARFFVSGGYLSNSGMYTTDKNANTYSTNSNQDLMTIRSNVDIHVNKRFNISLDINGRQEQRRWTGARGSAADIFRALINTPPNAFPVFQKEVDSATGMQMLGGTKDYTNNPYGLLNRKGYSLSLTRAMATSLKMNYELDFVTKGLFMHGELAFDSEYLMYTNRNKNFSVWNVDVDSDGQPKQEEGSKSYYIKTGSDTQMSPGGEYPSTSRKMNYRLGLHYSRSFGDHRIFAEALFNQREISQDIGDLPRIYRGGDGQISYQYKDKYLADFSMSMMGSEQFLKNDRFGIFPALSLGWIITQESFLKNNPVLSFLKIRGSVGETGWDDIGGYFLWYQKFSNQSGATSFGQTAISVDGIQEQAFALDNVTWEKDLKYNIGLDVRFFRDRIALTADVFKETNRDIMRAPELPYSMGIRFPDFPIGKVENKGIEVSLSYTDRIGNVKYGISGMVTYATNKILEMGEAQKLYPYQMATGHPLENRFGYIALGLFKSEEEIANSPKQTFTTVVKPGDIKYQDINNDGLIDSYDQTYLGGGPEPNLQGGVQLNLEWKGFDLSFLLTGSNGGWLQVTGESMWAFYNNGTANEHHLGRFNPNDESTWDNATYPRLSLSNNSGNQQTSTYWRINARQLRLKNFEIGYSIPVKWSKNVLNKLRFYVNAYNWLSWQNTDLVDVEARNGSYVQYPIQKILNFGLNVTF